MLAPQHDSKLLCQAGEPASCAPQTHPHLQTSTVLQAGILSCPLGMLAKHQAGSMANGDMTPSLISPGGKGGGKLHPPGSGAAALVKANFNAEGSLYICHYYSCHHQAKHSELTLWMRDHSGCCTEWGITQLSSWKSASHSGSALEMFEEGMG